MWPWIAGWFVGWAVTCGLLGFGISASPEYGERPWPSNEISAKFGFICVMCLVVWPLYLLHIGAGVVLCLFYVRRHKARQKAEKES